jgi:amino acid adenylation domain-containing protein
MTDEPVNNSDHPLMPADEDALLDILMTQAGFAGDYSDNIQANVATENVPLSFAQQRLWFLDQLAPGSSAYNMPTAVINLVGRLDTGALSNALRHIINRHDILRTRFQDVAGEPRQSIGDADPEWSLPVIDLRHLVSAEQTREIDRIATVEAATPFDLSSGPLFRFKLLIVRPDEHLLLITFHHIISDGWSLGIFYQELSSFYTALVTGQRTVLPALPVQYTDFAQWQHRDPERYERQLEYWMEQLANTASVLNLSTDRPRLKQMDSHPSRRYRFSFSAELSAQVRELAQKQNVTLFMFLLAAFKVLLYRYTRQGDICVGTNIANRTRTETENLIGFFANTLVIRSDLSGHLTFTELLQRVRAVVLEAYENQDISFEQIVEALQPERDLAITPFFQVMFVLQSEAPGLDLPDVVATFSETENGTAKFDLELEIIDAPTLLTGSLEFDVTLFNEDTIAGMARNFEALITGIVAQPDSDITRLPILAESERIRLLDTWNQTDRAFKLDDCFQQLFEKQVAKTPGAVAVSCGETQLTYQELNNRANQVAHLLVEYGVGPEGVVALLAERGINLLIMILAVLKAGGAYLPLDPRHPPNRYRQILAQSRFPLTLAAPKFLSRLDHAFDGITEGNRPLVLTIEDSLADDRAESNLPVSANLQNLAYVIFTSGSTGRPKGAMVEHRGMLNHLWSKVADLKLTANDLIAQNASQTFDISVWQFLAGLLVGGQVRIFPDEVAYDPRQLLVEVAGYQVTIFQAVPSLLRAMIQSSNTDTTSLPDLSQLRWIVPTGEALTTELARQWLSRYPEIPMLNAYGSTECSDDQCHHALSEISPDFDLPTIPIGKAMANVQMYILDEWLAPVPIGVPGELYVGGVGVGRGYFYDPARTAATFLPDPFSMSPGRRLYKTGDLGRYLPDGSIEFLGRVDFMVKIRGFRIELGEIEATLSRHPAIQEAVVLALTAEAETESAGEQYLAAYITSSGDKEVAVSELRAYVKEKLPDYMTPAVFMFLQAMPLSRNGKIDRNALPHVKKSDSRSRGQHLAPVGLVETQLAQIWMELLDLSQVGVSDNFFEVGGHSLLATQLIYQIQDVFQVDMPVRELFASSTIREQSRVIEALQKGEHSDMADRLDLEMESNLPPDIQPAGTPALALDAVTGGRAKLLLTGSTGFLGTFLLAELLRQTNAIICCLVRATDAAAARQRIITALTHFDLWQPGWEDRIEPVPGDLAKTDLGLSDGQIVELANTLMLSIIMGRMLILCIPITR